ncbi:DsbA family protein [Pseudoalteromonas sp. OOF1S-7]|uniref:2-hydroxychromene-2-carboxylate isomerase n=1 Tax=Pseudoalteromonas sp. OOF1S-7 TaxID=2917757 RepID=UPI001EF4F685|nr:DsbA family protein [Pseudoalteromonas sp. OOF1S-7]MCG7536689.1 DsbA family protein [Pseudoalteromonas sp. OOF1S-7]
MKPVYFFSFRSPYSWLASLALKSRIERNEIELVPFWEPDEQNASDLSARSGEFPYRAMSDAKHRYILKDIARLTKSFGLKISWPIDPAPWWELSHLGYLKAKELGVGNAFFWATYEARWQLGENISEKETLFKICERIGLNAELSQQVVAAADDSEIRAQGIDILYRIYREDVFGVPMFAMKRQQYWGLDRLNDFIEHAKLGSEEALDLPLSCKFALDLDHAGGCG